MTRRLLGMDVLTAARTRVSQAIDASERAYVSFSGGKDSTVLLSLVADEARRRGRTIGVLFVDLEAQYRLTIEHVHQCLDHYRDCIDPHWVALPLNLRNAVSVYEPQWTCWDPDRRKDWVRTPPSHAITDERRYPFFRRGMEFEDFVPRFAEWYAGEGQAVCFVGIRTQESLNRWRTIASGSKQRVNGWSWSTRKGHRSWNAYPLYDWTTEDIWTYHAEHSDVPVNGVYDLMHRAGLTIHQSRLCQPYGDDQRKGLWLFHLLEPETWGRVVARVNGANQGALYARESGNILGIGKVTCPDGHTWESFAGMMLDSLPSPTAEHYRRKIEIFIRWWHCRGYDTGIPDEADAAEEAARRVPSWRRICKALLRNDYWCKGLSFTQHKDQASYNRYAAMLNTRRRLLGGGTPHDRFVSECRATGVDLPGRPTSKQMAMLAALTGGSTPAHAWTAIARHMGCGLRQAKVTATRQHASDAIAALKESDAEFRLETYANRPRRKRGAAVEGLAGENYAPLD